MTYLTLFWSFFKIGLFSFGGGLSMLRLIEDEVTAHGWMSVPELVDFVAVAESTPGPIAVNLATFTGNRVCGFPGGLCATLGVVLPSFVVILIVAAFFDRFRKNKAVAGVMTGLKPAVIGLIGAALLSVAVAVFFPSGFAAAVFTDPWFFVSLGILSATLVMAFRKLHPAWIIGAAAAAGLAAGALIEGV